MKSEHGRKYNGAEHLEIPCVNWHVDEGFSVKIEKRATVFSAVRVRYIEGDECLLAPAVIVETGWETPTSLNEEEGYLC